MLSNKVNDDDDIWNFLLKPLSLTAKKSIHPAETEGHVLRSLEKKKRSFILKSTPYMSIHVKGYPLGN